MRTVAVIPVRKGSVRCVNKNIRPFAGSSLLEICINKLKQLPLDEIIVSSDSDEMLELALKLGATAIKRPDHLATSETQPSDLAEYIGREIDADFIFYVHCTSPLIKVETMRKFLETKFKFDFFDSLNSASLIKKHLWMDGFPLNYMRPRPNTQELPDIYALNYGLNLISKNDMIILRDFVGSKPKLYEISDEESFDIDTEEDFLLAEKIYETTRTA